MSFHHTRPNSLEIYEFLRRPEVFLFAMFYPEFAHARTFGGMFEDQGAVEVGLLGVVFEWRTMSFDFWGWNDVEHLEVLNGGVRDINFGN